MQAPGLVSPPVEETWEKNREKKDDDALWGKLWGTTKGARDAQLEGEGAGEVTWLHSPILPVGLVGRPYEEDPKHSSASIEQ
ncbi:hypothetical protein FOPE_04162 [Fonsecaea pedrosoi]|nr:hypothetical protein FOPE_04162 [Fonsecaea pedrosoi]